jgi:NADH-quinone oxidoreductase subunit G
VTPATDGARISIDDPEAREMRAAVIEFLMANHPHDCPVCDEGGECHLQDMTVMTGHTYRRYRFAKRTHRTQDLGPFVNHEMNRCIACYRCVRFYRDMAGGRDFGAFGRHDHVYLGRAADGPLESEFSGNLVEICPTGVFTDKTLKKHYTRKWDLQTAPSVCVHCGVGCNTIPGERYGTLRRIHNRYNGAVNGYFLCDRGRYGYEFVNSERRIRHPLVRRNGELKPASREEAIHAASALLLRRERVAGIGSPRASLEANFALRRLVGAGRFYSGMAANEQRLTALMAGMLREGPVRTPPLGEMATADAALVLGEDLANTAPMIAFAVRQIALRRRIKIAAGLRIPYWDDVAVRKATPHVRSPISIAAPAPTRLDDLAAQPWHAAPAELARLGFAVAHAIDPAAPDVPGLPAETEAAAREMAEALLRAERPLIVSGPACGSEALVQAAANVARALHAQGRRADLAFAMPECNAFGLTLMDGCDLSEAAHIIREGAVDTVVILENDLRRRADDATVEAILSAPHVIALDCLPSPTTERAEIVLPAATFADSEGTFINSEGRAQQFFKVMPPAALVPRYWAPGWNSVQALNKFQSEVAGPLVGGDPGVRLIEPARDEGLSYFREVPGAFTPRQQEWLFLPVYHIHGSDELLTSA